MHLPPCLNFIRTRRRVVTLEQTKYPDAKARTQADLALAFGVVSFMLAAANVFIFFYFISSHGVRRNARVVDSGEFDEVDDEGKSYKKGKRDRA